MTTIACTVFKKKHGHKRSPTMPTAQGCMYIFQCQHKKEASPFPLRWSDIANETKASIRKIEAQRAHTAMLCPKRTYADKSEQKRKKDHNTLDRVRRKPFFLGGKSRWQEKGE